MTTSLEAMKAARGRLQDLRESEFYWGKFLAVTRCGIHEALTLLDAAIQREEGGCAGADGCHPGCRASACSCPCHAAEITPTPPSGVVSREAAMNAAMVANAAGLDSQRWETVGPTVARALSAPSEPMVARSRAMEAARESYSAALQGVAWGDSERCAARILDGGGHE